MRFEDQRGLHEDLDRLEEAIASRYAEEPKNIRERLNRDHEISDFLTRIQTQSERLLEIYTDADGARQKEDQQIGTGDPLEEFKKQVGEIKDFHRRYPNEPVENLERAYRKVPRGEGEAGASDVDKLFSGEEVYGRYLDLVQLHEMYLNLRGVKGVLHRNYLQYLETFDEFEPEKSMLRREDKLSDDYLRYVDSLSNYLWSFMKRTRPLHDLDSISDKIGQDFDAKWSKDDVPGWSLRHPKIEEDHSAPTAEGTAPATEGSSFGIWCADCSKGFKNDNIYKAHLTGKKHIKAANLRQNPTNSTPHTNGTTTTNGTSSQSSTTAALTRLKERALAEREHRITRLASMMQTERHDTRMNIERRAGMTERERQAEREALFAESEAVYNNAGSDSEVSDDDDKIHNPLKLPISWDGRPIPYWLYKLHGLGVEYPCEICGGFVYAGRRAFEKHFGEARHTYGLKCLGVTNGGLFREITSIDEATKLQAKLEKDKKEEKLRGKDVEEMEDSEGNVMPRKVYEDLAKQGLI